MKLIIRLIICVVLVIGQTTLALKNPCRKNSGVEFIEHPESDHHYIQCSKRGEMYVKECGGNSVWNGEKKRCEESEQLSQIKTLAANYKIKQLLAKKSANKQSETTEAPSQSGNELAIEDKTELEIDMAIAERQRTELKMCSGMMCPTGFSCALDKDDLTLVCDPATPSTTTTSIPTATVKVTQSIEQLEDDTRTREMEMCEGMTCPSGFRCALDKIDSTLICDPILSTTTPALTATKTTTSTLAATITTTPSLRAPITTTPAIRATVKTTQSIESIEQLELDSRESEMCEGMTCPTGFRCALDKDVLTLICDPISATTTATTTPSTTPTTTPITTTTLTPAQAIEQLEIENRNIIHEMNGQAQIQATQKQMMSAETEQLKDMMSKQAEIDRPNLHRTSMQKFREEKQLQRQLQQLELKNRQDKSKLEKVKSMQKVREKDLLDMQVEMRENVIEAGREVEAHVVSEQRAREEAQMNEMIEKQKALVRAKVERDNKERGMCMEMTCPSGFRCALDKDDLTLICDPVA